MKWSTRLNMITEDANEIMMERLVLKKKLLKYECSVHLRLDIMIQINNEKDQTKSLKKLTSRKSVFLL